MTPAKVAEAARRRYNAVGDTFWSDDEIRDYIYQAEMDLARETWCIQNSYTTSTVASQQAYAWPSRALALKRITYDGTKLAPLSMKEDDVLTLVNSTTPDTGTPRYYFLWENSVYLRPIPADVLTLKIWTYDAPQEITSASTALSVPDQYHSNLVYFILAEMALKDMNPGLEGKYRDLWMKFLMRAKSQERKRIRGDAMAHVHAIETLMQSGLGNV